MKGAVSLIGTIAAAVSAAPAAANQWYIENGAKGARARIPVGRVVEVPTEGSMLLRMKVPGTGVVKEQCSVSGTDALSNSETEAFDEVRALRFFSCPKRVSVSARVPWRGVLGGDGQPFTEPLSGVALELTVNHVSRLFTGSLTADYGDGDPPHGDDIDNTFKLTGSSGVLDGPGGATLQVSAREKYGVKGVDRADGEPNGGPEETEGEAGG